MGGFRALGSRVLAVRLEGLGSTVLFSCMIRGRAGDPVEHESCQLGQQSYRRVQ